MNLEEIFGEFVNYNENDAFEFKSNYRNIQQALDDKFRHSVCFRETLNIYSINDLNTGTFFVTIKLDKDTFNIVYLVYILLKENINGVKHCSSVFSRVTPKFITLEERRTEYLQLADKKIERNLYIVNEGDSYHGSINFYDGKNWKRQILEIPIQDSTVLMGEGADFLYLRYLAQKGERRTSYFNVLLFDGTVHTSHYVSKLGGIRRVGRTKEEIYTITVDKKVLNPIGKIRSEWTLILGTGYIVEENRYVSPGCLRLKVFRYNDEGDDIKVDENTGKNFEDELQKIYSEHLASTAIKEAEKFKEYDEYSKYDLAEIFAPESSTGIRGEGTDSRKFDSSEDITSVKEDGTEEKTLQQEEDRLKDEISEVENQGLLVDKESSQRPSKVYSNSSEDYLDEAEDKFSEEEYTLPMNRKFNSDINILDDEASMENENNVAEPNDAVGEKTGKGDEDETIESDPDEKPSEKASEGSENENDPEEEESDDGDSKKSSKKRKPPDYDSYVWPDMDIVKQEIEKEEKGRKLEDILAEIEKTNEECTKIKEHNRYLDAEAEKLRRQLWGFPINTEKLDWFLIEGFKRIAVHKNCLVFKDGKIDQSRIPLIYKWREDAFLISAYNERKKCRKEEMKRYLAKHPEISDFMSDFLMHILLRQPKDVIKFTINYFK